MRAYMMIGLPGSGKSSFIESVIDPECYYYLISSDYELERLCDRADMTYEQGFQRFIKEATTNMWDRFEDALNRREYMVIDRTNMTVKSRKRFMDALNRAEYTVIAIHVNTPFERCVNNCANRIGKHIPMHVLTGMSDAFEVPTVAEGFRAIYTVGY